MSTVALAQWLTYASPTASTPSSTNDNGGTIRMEEHRYQFNGDDSQTAYGLHQGQISDERHRMLSQLYHHPPTQPHRHLLQLIAAVKTEDRSTDPISYNNNNSNNSNNDDNVWRSCYRFGEDGNSSRCRGNEDCYRQYNEQKPSAEWNEKQLENRCNASGGSGRGGNNASLTVLTSSHMYLRSCT